MKTRAVASIAIAVALGFGLTACNYISPQRTTMQYDASDGVSAVVGDLEVRNALFLIDPEKGEGTAEVASLLFAVVNHTGEAAEFTISVGGSNTQTTIVVPAGETLVPVGYGEGQSIIIEGTEFVGGSTHVVTFTPSEGGSTTVNVPVLDGTLAEYSTLLPTVAPTTIPPVEPTETDAPAEGDEEDPAATEPAAE